MQAGPNDWTVKAGTKALTQFAPKSRPFPHPNQEEISEQFDDIEFALSRIIDPDFAKR